MKQPKNLAEFWLQAEENSIKGAIATLERIAMKNENIFIRIEASKFSLNDTFMEYIPRTQKQAEFKIALCYGIVKGYKDFWISKIAPSFNADKDGIRYEFGKKPAVGKGYKWWKKVAKEFWPARKSRLGTELEYIAFLRVVIEKLVDVAGWKIEDAWYAVCDDSEKLGGYWNDLDPEFGLSDTGTFEICGLYDLVGAYKMLASDDVVEGIFRAGGTSQCSDIMYPAAKIGLYGLMAAILECTTGWVILEEDCA